MFFAGGVYCGNALTFAPEFVFEESAGATITIGSEPVVVAVPVLVLLFVGGIKTGATPTVCGVCENANAEQKINVPSIKNLFMIKLFHDN